MSDAEMIKLLLEWKALGEQLQDRLEPYIGHNDTAWALHDDVTGALRKINGWAANDIPHQEHS